MARITSYFLISSIWSYTAVLFAIFPNYSSDPVELYEDINQQQEINGRVIDQATGNPIPFCNIGIASSPWGTASNELGEFVIKVDSLPAKLIFTHINYNKYVVEVDLTTTLIVELTPFSNVLEEVIVTASKKDAYALELAKKAFQKANKQTTKPNYGRAFYRQKSKNGNEYSEFSEIIYDIRYNSRGIEDWDIIEGRYALKPGGLHNRNYTLLTRLISPFQPNTEEVIFPMHPALEVFYDIHIVEYIESSSDKIAVLKFKPKKTIKTPTFEAEVYINLKTYDILKITGSLSHDDLKFVQLVNNNNNSWKNYNISFEMAYNPENTGNSSIDYINIAQEFDYHINDNFEFHTTSSSNLTFFENYKPTSRKKLGGQFGKNKTDWQKLDEIGYNEKFWEDNPIVKRTPVEEEVITSFAKVGAFGSIFLNSKDQVALLQSNLTNDPFMGDLGVSVNQYNNYNPVEKVFLHTDKELFTTGETIWFSGYTVLGRYHQFSLGSRVLHVDLIGPKNEIVLSQTQEIVNGKATGNMDLPSNLHSGNYQLRAYSNWMRNFDHDFFFTKTIQVFNDLSTPLSALPKEDKIDLQFFPEGGHLVADLVGQVAFKAIGNDGLNRNIKGQIVDSQGKFMAALATIDRGSGFFNLKPQAGEKYSVILEDGTKFPLPEVMSEGYAITAYNVNPKSIQVKIQASETLREQFFYVLGHINNKKYYQGKFNFEGEPAVNFEMPKSKMPSGIMTLTLFDSQKKPWSERIVFINNQDELVINANLNPKKFKDRSEITIDVHVSDTDGRPVMAELSMAATDVDQGLKSPNSANILTHLLLQSDIKGHISDPGLLFLNQKKATLHALDLVMLTHGWRKIPWPEIKVVSNSTKEFNFVKGLTISGIATNLNNKPLANTHLTVIAKSGEQLGMLSAKTTLNGSFTIPDFNFKDTTKIAFNAFDNSDSPIDVKIIIDKQKTTLPPSRFINLHFQAEKYMQIPHPQRILFPAFDINKTTKLDEVIITEKRTEKSRNASPSVYGQTPDASLYMEDNRSAQTVLDLVRRFAGVSVNGNTVSIRNGGSPLWILNGVPVNNDNPSASSQARSTQRQRTSTDQGAGSAVPVNLSLSMEQSMSPGPVPTYITTMDTYTVERVEILKGPSAAIYGSRGANGVILIYTKRGGAKTISPAVSPEFAIEGHAPQREFYSPKYNVTLDENSAPDNRATLYWNPSFTTDKNGNARLLFYNSDNAKQIQVHIEGLSLYGTPGNYLQSFSVKD
ncbi:hypothetical protein DHD32_11980 [Arenibacter sp. TNZ]|jgi:TonB-dependent SusC/RagA subfamily outer membrane receptor|uniref:carboxypeptidase-like regulatory domain-containing protein n=1 Tax=Arenibacter TaxID=178469 RepID=UPI000CD43CD6|nr:MULTISPECIES: carboxypeptidase-like regulatory domain-containing protein [Arenibacter]MCM4172202.1 hypothetical protein [Arenibacter sp. TNZ]